MHPMLNTAVKAARDAAEIIQFGARNLDRLTIDSKGPGDFVTEIDRKAEETIVDTLLGAYPNHGIIAEEGSGNTRGNSQSDHIWIIDPLDGTTNFLHGVPQYAVSIGLVQKGVITQAVVYDTNRNDLYTATRGRGAYCNDKRLRVSKTLHLKDALISTGFPFRDLQNLDQYLAMFRSVTEKCAGIRRPGAAALDLAWVASGRFDGFWEMGLAPWDLAAGALLITESGGLVADLDGTENFMESGNLVCGSPKVFAQLLQLVGAHAPKSKTIK